MYIWFFFFKQKTAYEMRISDWSSDVCSSDLAARRQVDAARNDGHADSRGIGGAARAAAAAALADVAALRRGRSGGRTGIGDFPPTQAVGRGYAPDAWVSEFAGRRGRSPDLRPYTRVPKILSPPSPRPRSEEP